MCRKHFGKEDIFVESITRCEHGTKENQRKKTIVGMVIVTILIFVMTIGPAGKLMDCQAHHT
jgi:hypothetical protein